MKRCSVVMLSIAMYRTHNELHVEAQTLDDHQNPLLCLTLFCPRVSRPSLAFARVWDPAQESADEEGPHHL